MKELINANEYGFEIRRSPRPFGGYCIYLNHESFCQERMLCERWTVSECRDWIFSHFIGEKGTKFNINVIESEMKTE